MQRSWQGRYSLLLEKFQISRVSHQSPSAIPVRSSHLRSSIRIDLLKNFAKFTEKHLCQSLFLNKVTGSDLKHYSKRDSGTGVFLWILQFFQEHLFYWTPLGDCFWLFRYPFSWVRVYHFITLLETWMFIQCFIDFHLWTVAKYNNWVCFKHIICFVTI